MSQRPSPLLGRATRRVRWRDDGSANVCGVRIEAVRSNYAWAGAVFADDIRWHSWHATEREARRAAIALARRLAGAR